MGGIGHDDLGALRLPSKAEILLNAAYSGELALSPRHGLQRDLIHPRTNFEHVLHFVIDGQQTLEMVFGLMGMDVGDAGKLRNDLVHAGVVLHGARPKGIESGIDAKVSLGEPGVVTNHLGLGKARPASLLLTNQPGGNDGRGGASKTIGLRVAGVFGPVVAEEMTQALTS